MTARTPNDNLNRRAFTKSSLRALSAASATSLLSNLPTVHAANYQTSIQAIWGSCSGDISTEGGVLWSRCDRPAQMQLEVSTDGNFRNAQRFIGPDALEVTDFTAKFPIRGFDPGKRIYYRIQFQDLAQPSSLSDPITGSFLTAPRGTAKSAEQLMDINFVWSGDTAGQGYGIDLARGGMRTYETMRKLKPDFFVHSGDQIYADGPFPETMEIDGGTWNNQQLEGTSKVAETLDEFRANFRYNLLDENVRKFYSEVPMFAQWDDHETTNNWYPGEVLADKRYREKSASLLAARAKRAFCEYMPIARLGGDGQRIYRSAKYGPLLELFFLDMRTFRGPNSSNNQTHASKESALLGRTQLDWLKRKIARSTATWKFICSDMPLGLIVRDGEAFENGANGDGKPLGRELEIAELLRFLKMRSVKNVVWITADVHYAASHFYDPTQAQFQDFDPFWEFVSGPLHAGTFGPGELDNTFGPQVKFNSIPNDMKPDRPPSDGLQFFGQVQINAKSQIASVTHYDVAGNKLWSKNLEPAS